MKITLTVKVTRDEDNALENAYLNTRLINIPIIQIRVINNIFCESIKYVF